MQYIFIYSYNDKGLCLALQPINGTECFNFPLKKAIRLTRESPANRIAFQSSIGNSNSTSVSTSYPVACGVKSNKYFVAPKSDVESAANMDGASS